MSSFSNVLGHSELRDPQQTTTINEGEQRRHVILLELINWTSRSARSTPQVRHDAPAPVGLPKAIASNNLLP